MTRRSRDPLEREYTPDWTAQAIARELYQFGFLGRGTHVWEPHAGDGVIVDAVQAYTDVPVIGTDLAPARHDIRLRDAMDGPPEGFAPDLIVGNPPFSEAERHIDSFLSNTNATVAMLLRVGFLETQRRGPFFEKWGLPRGLHFFPKRPSFRPGYATDRKPGTDSQCYALMVWPEIRGPHPYHVRVDLEGLC